jgi:antitoxin component YwqK of YwqJK toxin-antitoxin module
VTNLFKNIKYCLNNKHKCNVIKKYKDINLMKYLIIISYLLCTSIGWSKDISWYDLEVRDGLYYEKSKNVLFTGEMNGKELGKIIKGKKEGEWLEYWDNGQLYSRKNYKDGKYDGKYSSYYESKKDGELLDYYESGVLNWKETFKKGIIEGQSLIYFETGTLWYNTNFKNGKRHGEYLKYNSNGKLIEKKFYKEGVLIETVNLQDANNNKNTKKNK